MAAAAMSAINTNRSDSLPEPQEVPPTPFGAGWTAEDTAALKALVRMGPPPTA